MKPWLETWSRCSGDVEVKYGTIDFDELLIDYSPDGYPETVAAIVAAAPDMCRALLAVERIAADDKPRCPFCWCSSKERGGDGHDDECVLDLALTKAGLATQEQRDAARKEIGL
jgi:hypothetical protein